MRLNFPAQGQMKIIYLALDFEDLQIGASPKPLVECDYVFCLPFQCSAGDLSKWFPWEASLAIEGWDRIGLEPASNLFAHEVIEEEMGTEMATGYLTGPIMLDIAVGKPAAMSLAMNLSQGDLANCVMRSVLLC